MNVLLEYLYRDSGNYKNYESLIFSNSSNFDQAVLNSKIKEALIDGEFFIAEDIKFPSLYFSERNDDLDHGWHEFFCIKITTEPLNDSPRRDIGEIIHGLIESKEKRIF